MIPYQIHSFPRYKVRDLLFNSNDDLNVLLFLYFCLNLLPLPVLLGLVMCPPILPFPLVQDHALNGDKTFNEA